MTDIEIKQMTDDQLRILRGQMVKGLEQIFRTLNEGLKAEERGEITEHVGGAITPENTTAVIIIALVDEVLELREFKRRVGST